MTESMTEKLKSALAKRDDVVLAFLFGSFPRGETTPFSDLDIAVFFNRPIDFFTIAALREDISAMTGMAADIVVLNTASPVIRMQVLKKGTMLINKDQKVYNAFFVDTINSYDDLKRTRKPIEDNILKGRIYA